MVILPIEFQFPLVLVEHTVTHRSPHAYPPPPMSPPLTHPYTPPPLPVSPPPLTPLLRVSPLLGSQLLMAHQVISKLAGRRDWEGVEIQVDATLDQGNSTMGHLLHLESFLPMRGAHRKLHLC